MSHNTATIVAREDEEIIIRTKKKDKSSDDDQKYSLPYKMVGDFRMSQGVQKGYGFIDVLLTMSTPEQWFFKLLKDHLDYRNNIATIPSQSFNKTQTNKLSLAYKSLNQKELVKRVSPHRYMINPDAIINPKTYEQNKLLWDQL